MTSDVAGTAGHRIPGFGISGLRCRPVQSVRVAEYEAGARYGPRVLTSYEWVWLLRGSARWSGRAGARRHDHRLYPGSLLLARAGMQDCYTWDPDTVSRHAFVHFEIDRAADAAAPAEEDWPTVRDMDVSPVFDGLTGYLLELAGDPSAASAARTEHLLTTLLDIFVVGPIQSRPRLGPQLVAIADRVRRIWQDEGMRLVEIVELARAVGLSKGHVSRIFATELGIGPAAALEQIRLARAAILLQRSNSSLREVARQTGFANAYHLSRRFRLTHGVPPGRFRRSVPAPDPMAPLGASGLIGLGDLLLNAPPAVRDQPRFRPPTGSPGPCPHPLTGRPAGWHRCTIARSGRIALPAGQRVSRLG